MSRSSIGRVGHAGGLGGLGHGRCDAQDEARIEGLGDDVVGAESQLLALVGGGHLFADVGLGQLGDLAHAGQLHLFRDLGCAAVQRAAEDVGEAQHVIDLVRVVRAAGGDDAVGPHFLGQLGPDLGLGVGQRQDDGLVGHGLDHVLRDHAGRRAAEEDVGVLHHIGQGAGAAVRLRIARLRVVEAARAADVDQALGVDREDVGGLGAHAHHHIQAGDGGGAGAGDGDLHFLDLLADQLQPVDQRRSRDDGGAVLVVMEHRDVHALAQLAFDVEALGRLDVLEVDAAQRGLQRGDDLDQLVGVEFGQLDVEHVDAGELLEEAALAFHHRLGGQRADVAEAQHRGAVGDHAHQVAARGELGGHGGVGLDVEARVGDAGGVGQREVALVQQRLRRRDGNLAFRGAAVVLAGGIAQCFFCWGQGGGHEKSPWFC